MKKYFFRLFSAQTFAISVGVTIFLAGISFWLVIVTAPPTVDGSNIIALSTIVPYSTENAITATQVGDPYIPTSIPSPAPGQISIGSVVQVTGTEGTGLRFRSQPALTGAEVFMAYDTEAFNVVDGPRQVDGYTWYYLTSVNDDARTGWAVTNYLSPINQ